MLTKNTSVVIRCQCHSCWWPGDPRILGIIMHGIGLICRRYSVLAQKKLKKKGGFRHFVVKSFIMMIVDDEGAMVSYVLLIPYINLSSFSFYLYQWFILQLLLKDDKYHWSQWWHISNQHYIYLFWNEYDILNLNLDLNCHETESPHSIINPLWREVITLVVMPNCWLVMKKYREIPVEESEDKD